MNQISVSDDEYKHGLTEPKTHIHEPLVSSSQGRKVVSRVWVCGIIL